MGFEIYRETGGDYRWRFRASNNRIIADSGEGYRNRGDCEHGIQLLKNEAPRAVVTDLTATSANRRNIWRS